MSDLKISLVQSFLHWERPAENRNKLQQLIEQIEETDLILLPEMFPSGFTMNTSMVAEKMDGESIHWMREMAREKDAVVCGSIIIEEEGKFYNRLIWMQANGEYFTYDKRHLFRMAEEHNYFSAGEEQLIVQLKGWNICPLICYDLRFPVWSRNRYETDRLTYAKPAYDLLLYVANWPEARVSAWEKLLLARAIENQVYVAGLNRIGTDDNGIAYSGNSVLVDPKGELIWKAKDHQEEVKTIVVNRDELDAFRKKFPVGMDGDQFEID